MKHFIATRSLEADGTTISVSVGAPTPDDADTWKCSFEIQVGNAEPECHFAYGSDPLQALLMAIAALRLHLNDSNLPLRWLGASEDGDHGIPYFVPTAFGADFADRMERLVEHHIRDEFIPDSANPPSEQLDS